MLLWKTVFHTFPTHFKELNISTLITSPRNTVSNISEYFNPCLSSPGSEIPQICQKLPFQLWIIFAAKVFSLGLVKSAISRHSNPTVRNLLAINALDYSADPNSCFSPTPFFVGKKQPNKKKAAQLLSEHASRS